MITRDPERLGGQPCIRDLRLSARRVLQAIALYPDREDLRREYPELEDEEIRQALDLAAARSSPETVNALLTGRGPHRSSISSNHPESPAGSVTQAPCRT